MYVPKAMLLLASAASLITASTSAPTPADDSVTFQKRANVNGCHRGTYFGYYTYLVTIEPQPGQAQAMCGQGYLDNLHGRGCTVTAWSCNFVPGEGYTMTFNTDLFCGSQVQDAIYLASDPHLTGVTCVPA